MLVKYAPIVFNGTFLKNSKNIVFRQSSTLHHRDYLKERLVEIIPETRSRFNEFKSKHGSVVIDKVTVDQLFGGMRNIKCLYHEPSLLDSVEGIKFRGLSTDQIIKKLPKPVKSSEPLPEALFWFLLTGEIPTTEEAEWLSGELMRRSELPYYLVNIISSFPDNLHPMAQLSAAVTLLSRFSKFSVTYNTGGVPKSELWKPMYEDCMNLIAKVPVIAAQIYRNSFHNGSMDPIDADKDWANNFANMLGINKSPAFADYLRLYLCVHADHEGGNVSSHTASLVGSSLSDVYLSYAAAINGLAGPLHGRASQEVVEWIYKMTSTLGPNNLTEDQISEYCVNALSQGVIPGFGHAVLRQTDPRYTALRQFVERSIPTCPAIDIIDKLYKIVPKILHQTNKVKNPWPNVDAISGTILKHFNLTEVEYYAVPFGVSRSLGICSSIIWARALSLPLERPKSLDMKEVQAIVDQATDKNPQAA